jgi:two-component system osmolarity sensor histidine kinase EnvZ
MSTDGNTIAGEAGGRARSESTHQPHPTVQRLSRKSLLRNLLPGRLLARVLLIAVVPLILLQLITAYLFFERPYQSMTKRLSLALAGEILFVMNELDEPGGLSNDQLFERALETMEMKIVLHRGATLPAEPPHPLFGILDDRLNRALKRHFSNVPYHIDTESDPDLIQIHIQRDDGVLEVVTSRKRLFASDAFYTFVIWIGASAILVVVLASVFLRAQLRPIRLLARQAERFGKGRNVPDMPVAGAEEVKLAAHAFNEMRERIRRQIEQRTDMLSGVSHDLRTPLTRMKLQLAMLGDVPEAADMRADIEDMERMIEGYLAFARGEGTEEAVPSDIYELVRAAVETNRGGRAAIDIDGEPPMPVTLKPEAVRRALTNLIGNAMRYGTQVQVRMRDRGGAYKITIDDNGPGIPEDQREAAFRPFYRIESSRNPATGGIGLGLTIARDVFRSHGGDVTLHDSPLGGLRVAVWLPY